MKLTKSQIDYATTRLNDNISKRIKQELGDRPKNQIYDNQALIDFITNKKTKLKSVDELQKIFANGSHYYRSEILSMFELPPNWNKDYTQWGEKEAKLQAEYTKKKQEILDQLHLSGDAESALKLINSI
jgi:hypothetical protein